MKFWIDVGNSSKFLTPFPDCLYRVRRRRYSHSNLPLSGEVVENLPLSGEVVERKVHSFWTPIFCGEIDQNVLRQFVTVVYAYRGRKFGWVLSAELHVRIPAMEKNAELSESR